MKAAAVTARVARSTRRCVARAALALLAGIPGVACADEWQYASTERYEGYAYATDGATLLYSETHWLYSDDGVPTRLVVYRCPDGRPFARKTLRDVDGASEPDFEFTDGRDGHREGVRRSAVGREVYWQERAGSPLQARQLEQGGDIVIDAGFDAFIRAQWNSISTAAPLKARLLLPSRFAALDVRIEDATTSADRAARQRRMQVRLDAWYAFALPAMSLVYGEDRRLREFRGIGTIRDSRGRNQEVVIRFPPDQRADEGDGAEIAAAAGAELAGRCAP